MADEGSPHSDLKPNLEDETQKRRLSDIAWALHDVWFIVLFIITAVAWDVHLHEVILHSCFAASTFAVVRTAEYSRKKRESTQLYRALYDKAREPADLEHLRKLFDRYKNWQYTFSMYYYLTLTCWFAGTVFTARAMHELAPHYCNLPKHAFYELKYWTFPEEVNLTLIRLVGALAGFAFAIAVIQTVRCRIHEANINVPAVVSKLIK